MSIGAWHEEAVSKKHARENFDCGEPALNEFLQHQARRSHELGGSKTFVAIDDATQQSILGYYTVSHASLNYARTPEIARRGLARYDVPCFRLARLAVDLRYQGGGLGGELLMAAGRRCVLAAAQVGGVALLIDAKSERAANWYANFGAIVLADSPLTLTIPLATIARALGL